MRMTRIDRRASVPTGGAGCLSSGAQIPSDAARQEALAACAVRQVAPVRYPAALIALAATSLPSSVGAQAPTVPWHAVPVVARWHGSTSLAGAVIDSTRIPSTYWKEGALVGGGLLAVLVGAGALELCHYDGPCHHPVLAVTGGGVLGALIGTGIGALIGGQFPKHR